MQKRPSDTTIRVSRVTFGLIYIIALYYNFFLQAETNTIEDTLFFGTLVLNESTIEYAKYVLISLGVIPVFMGASNICLLKKKYMRYIQVFFGIVLFYVGGIIVETPSIDVDSLITFMGIFPLFAGITGKCITSNCMKYAEKVTKIRV